MVSKKEKIGEIIVNLLRFFYPAYRPKPKELLDLIEWSKNNEVADNIYHPPSYYKPQAFYIDNNDKVKRKTNAKGDSPTLDIEDINPKNDLDIDLEAVLASIVIESDMAEEGGDDNSKLGDIVNKVIPLGKALFNLTPTKLQILAHLPQGGGDVNGSRDSSKRKKLKSHIIPTVDENGKNYRTSRTEVVDGKEKVITTNRLDRTHLLPIGYHGTESSSFLLTFWDGETNKGVFNQFENQKKTINEPILWLTSVERVKTKTLDGVDGYYLKWHYSVVPILSGEIDELFEQMGGKGKPIQGVWRLHNGLNVWTPQSEREQKALEEFERQRDEEEENQIEYNYDFQPELEKAYSLKTKAKNVLEFQVGVDTKTGKPVMMDLAKCPHLLVAGTTGSGKSVGVNSWIEQIMAHNTPYDVLFFGIDPKRVELNAYTDSPFFPINPIRGEDKAVEFLCWFTEITEDRYKTLDKAGALNLDNYHELIEASPDWARENGFFHMPRLVLFIDEFSNLMSRAGKMVEGYVGQLAEKARAAGVHMIIATQNPTVDVISSKIKANIVTRVCFKVSSWTSSMVVLDENGGEKLLGRGDMLVKDSNLSSFTIRAQSLYIDDKEKKSQLDYYKSIYPRAKDIDWEQELLDRDKAEFNEEGKLVLK